MKFKVDAAKIKRAFNALGDVITGNIPNPLTHYVFWHLCGNVLRLEAVSSDSSVILNTGIDVEGAEDGMCWLEHSVVDKALSYAEKDERIKFAMTDKIHMRAAIGTRRFTWKAAAGNWPEMPELKGQAYALPAKLIKELMRRGAVGAAKVAGRFDTDSIKLGFTGSLVWIESIGGSYGVRAEADLPEAVPPAEALLQKKLLKAINSILVGEELLVVRIGDFRVEFITEVSRLSVGTISGTLPSMKDLLGKLTQPPFISIVPAMLIERLSPFQGLNEDGCIEFDLQANVGLTLRGASDMVSGQSNFIEDTLPLAVSNTVIAQFRVEYWQIILGGVRDIPQAVFGIGGAKEPSWIVGASDLVRYTGVITPRAIQVKMNATAGRDAWAEE